MSAFAIPRQRARLGLLRRFNLEAVARRLQAAAPVAAIQCNTLKGAALAVVDELLHDLTEKRT